MGSNRVAVRTASLAVRTARFAVRTAAGPQLDRSRTASQTSRHSPEEFFSPLRFICPTAGSTARRIHLTCNLHHLLLYATDRTAGRLAAALRSGPQLDRGWTASLAVRTANLAVRTANI